jgi:hypothetical protein
MTYALVVDGQISKLGPRPSWRIGETFENSRPLTDEELAERGWFCVAAAPAHNPDTHKLVEIPLAEWTIGSATVGPQFRAVPLTATELIERAEQRRLAALPSPVTTRQAKLALLAAGLLDRAEAAAHQAGRAAQIEWEYATEYQRDNPLIGAIGEKLGLTEEQIDDLFRDAAAL